MIHLVSLTICFGSLLIGFGGCCLTQALLYETAGSGAYEDRQNLSVERAWWTPEGDILALATESVGHFNRKVTVTVPMAQVDQALLATGLVDRDSQLAIASHRRFVSVNLTRSSVSRGWPDSSTLTGQRRVEIPIVNLGRQHSIGDLPYNCATSETGPVLVNNGPAGQGVTMVWSAPFWDNKRVIRFSVEKGRKGGRSVLWAALPFAVVGDLVSWPIQFVAGWLDWEKKGVKGGKV